MKEILKKALSMGLAVTMLASLAACGSSSTDTTTDATATEGGTQDSAVVDTTDATSSGEPVYGGSLTMYYHEFYNLFQPEIPISYGYALWMEGLWSVNPDYVDGYVSYTDMVGQIADSWTTPDDYSSLTVTIRDDVCFQTKDGEYNIYDGRNVTADDVKYTYDRLLGIGSGWDTPVECEMNWSSELYMLDSVESDGALTVTFNFNTQSEVALSTFMTTIINICGPEWDELTADQQADWHYANGTGPFILTNVNGTSSMSFERNPNYYQHDEDYPDNQLPYLDSVTLLHIDDSSDTLAQFIAGSLDWIGSTSSVLSTSEIAQLSASLDSSSYTEYTYSTAAPASIQLKNNVAPFNDKNVRIAMQKAINVEEVMSAYYGDTSDDAVIPGIWAANLVEYTSVNDWSDELKDEYSYDPDAAKQLLADAGYPDGFEFTITLAPNADTNLYVLAQSYLNAVGITMNIENATDIMEAISVSTNADNPNAVSGTHGGKSSFPIIKMTTLATGANYGLFAQDTEDYATYADAVENYSSATTLSDQNAYAQAMDLAYAEAHWDIALSGINPLHEFISSRVHGYDGQRMVNNQTRRSLVARMWVDS